MNMSMDPVLTSYFLSLFVSNQNRLIFWMTLILSLLRVLLDFLDDKITSTSKLIESNRS